MRAILSDPDQDNLIQESQERDHEYTPLSEEAKKKMHSKGSALSEASAMRPLSALFYIRKSLRLGSVGKKIRPQPAVV